MPWRPPCPAVLQLGELPSLARKQYLYTAKRHRLRFRAALTRAPRLNGPAPASEGSQLSCLFMTAGAYIG